VRLTTRFHLVQSLECIPQSPARPLRRACTIPVAVSLISGYGLADKGSESLGRQYGVWLLAAVIPLNSLLLQMYYEYNDS
jgi:hypothetical protein